MPLDTFKTRMPDNVAGKFYVGDQCLDCDLCRALAPANFARNDEGGYSYVKKQPETSEEVAACRKAVQGCCTETIFADGDSFDWAVIPAPTPYHLTPEGQAQRAQWRKQETLHDCCKTPDKPSAASPHPQMTPSMTPLQRRYLQVYLHFRERPMTVSALWWANRRHYAIMLLVFGGLAALVHLTFGTVGVAFVAAAFSVVVLRDIGYYTRAHQVLEFSRQTIVPKIAVPHSSSGCSKSPILDAREYTGIRRPFGPSCDR